MHHTLRTRACTCTLLVVSTLVLACNTLSEVDDDGASADALDSTGEVCGVTASPAPPGEAVVSDTGCAEYCAGVYAPGCDWVGITQFDDKSLDCDTICRTWQPGTDGELTGSTLGCRLNYLREAGSNTDFCAATVPESAQCSNASDAGCWSACLLVRAHCGDTFHGLFDSPSSAEEDCVQRCMANSGGGTAALGLAALALGYQCIKVGDALQPDCTAP